MSAGLAWTLEDDTALILGAAAGKSRRAIGVQLGRTVEAVSYRAAELRKRGIAIPSLQKTSASKSELRLRELRKIVESLPKGMS